MKKLMKNIKLMVAASTVLALFAVAPVVHGGILWTGIDPIFNVNDQKFNVRVEWPSQYDCSISDPIQVQVKVPKDASVNFIAESGVLIDGCDGHIRTNTDIVFDKKSNNMVKVKATVFSSESFPVKVHVDVNDKLVRTYTGESNGAVTGKPINIVPHGKGNNESDISTNNILFYTYEDDTGSSGNEDDDDDDGHDDERGKRDKKGRR